MASVGVGGPDPVGQACKEEARVEEAERALTKLCWGRGWGCMFGGERVSRGVAGAGWGSGDLGADLLGGGQRGAGGGGVSLKYFVSGWGWGVVKVGVTWGQACKEEARVEEAERALTKVSWEAFVTGGWGGGGTGEMELPLHATTLCCHCPHGITS